MILSLPINYNGYKRSDCCVIQKRSLIRTMVHMRVIDSFLYNGEPIVAFRLKLLDPVVDEFIITECKYTHSGKEKPFLWCDKNAEVFEPYKHKVRIVKLEEIPPMPEDWMKRSHSGFMKNAMDWWRENYQRDVIANYVQENSVNSVDKDTPFILICTDADEIPNPAIFQHREMLYNQMLTDPVYFQMMFFYYNFQWRKSELWYSGYMVTDQTYKKDTLSNLRCYYPKRLIVRDGGWHCGYFFSLEDLQRKIDSFAHQEWNHEKYKDPAHLRFCLDNGKDLFLRDKEDMNLHDMTGLPGGWQEVQKEILKIQE